MQGGSLLVDGDRRTTKRTEGLVPTQQTGWHHRDTEVGEVDYFITNSFKYIYCRVVHWLKC